MKLNHPPKLILWLVEHQLLRNKRTQFTRKLLHQAATISTHKLDPQKQFKHHKKTNLLDVVINHKILINLLENLS